MNRDAAIEAGARALYERQYPPNPESGWPRWESVAEQYREEPLRTAAAVIDAAAPYMAGEPVGYVVVNNAGSPLEFFITQAAAEAYAARLNSPDWRARTDPYRVVALTPIEDQP